MCHANIELYWLHWGPVWILSYCKGLASHLWKVSSMKLAGTLLNVGRAWFATLQHALCPWFFGMTCTVKRCPVPRNNWVLLWVATYNVFATYTRVHLFLGTWHLSHLCCSSFKQVTIWIHSNISYMYVAHLSNRSKYESIEALKALQHGLASKSDGVKHATTWLSIYCSLTRPLQHCLLRLLTGFRLHFLSTI